MQPEPSHAPHKPVMDVSPPKPPVLPAPMPGTAGPTANPVTVPAPKPPAAASEKSAGSEPLVIKQAPLANLELEENNSGMAAPPPLSAEELAQASREVSEDSDNPKKSAKPKKAAPAGPPAPVGFIVMTVAVMVVLSGIAVAIYMTSSS